MKDLATKDKPIRASHLPTLISCPWKFLMIYTTPQHTGEGTIDEGNEAAQTGSLLHRFVENWYSEKPIDSVDFSKLPKANREDAYRMFQHYCNDPRNQVKPVLVEREFKLTIPHHPEDKTKKAIHIWGHLDQVRGDEVSGYRLWDIKSSKYPGFQSLCHYITQIAAYTLGARQVLKRNVLMGGVIMTRYYNLKDRNPVTSPPGVFFQYCQGSQNLDLILEPVRHKIALLRNGNVYATPNQSCTYCFAGGPDQCLDLLREVKEGVKKGKTNTTPMELEITL